MHNNGLCRELRALKVFCCGENIPTDRRTCSSKKKKEGLPFIARSHSWK